VLLAALSKRKLTVLATLLLLATVAWPMAKLGSEFMPPLYEGGPAVYANNLARIIRRRGGQYFANHRSPDPGTAEVERVFGKAGRADTATDPAPLSMLETTILLKPRDQWPPGETVEQLIRKLDDQVRLPGLTNSWGYPIRTRIDMLSTGIRTPLELKSLARTWPHR